MHSKHSFPFGPEVAAERRAAAKEVLRASNFSALAIPVDFQPTRPRLAGWGAVDDSITTVTITYGTVPESDLWVSVSTSRWTDTSANSGPLQGDLEHYMLQRGMPFASATLSTRETSILIDNSRVEAQLICVGEEPWAARGKKGDIEVTIIAYGWKSDALTLSFLSELEPLIAEYPGTPARSGQSDYPSIKPVETLVGEDPRRTLIDATLKQSRETTEWMMGGGAAPPPIPRMSDLWHDAVRRQITLTDQSEPDARRAISNAVDHLCNLSHSAEWFHRDPALREQAVSETLLFSTGMSADISSRRAQDAWSREFSHHSDANDSAETNADSHTGDWEIAWADWASSNSDN